MVDSMKQIQDMTAELQSFKDAAKLVVDLVDLVAGRTAEGKLYCNVCRRPPRTSWLM